MPSRPATHCSCTGSDSVRDQTIDLDEFGRFAEPALLILISLADGPKHGYAVTEDIAAFADVRFGPGTLYAAIARLEARGLIDALDADDRRNPYELTAVGEKALRARLASIQAAALAPAIRRRVSRADRAADVISMRYWLVKGWSTRAQAVFIGGLLSVLVGMTMLAGWLGR